MTRKTCTCGMLSIILITLFLIDTDSHIIFC